MPGKSLKLRCHAELELDPRVAIERDVAVLVDEAEGKFWREAAIKSTRSKNY